VSLAQLREQAKAKWADLLGGDRPTIWSGLATCGLASGAAEVLEAAEDELRTLGLEARVVPVGCIGTCYAEPLLDLQKPGGPRVSYGGVTPELAREIVRSYFRDNDPRPDLALGTIGDGAVEGLPRFFDLPMLEPQVRIVTRNLGLIDPEDIDHYLAAGGYEGLEKALAMEPEAVIEEVLASGLRGRGGAGFPTGLKWRFARQAPGSPKYLICNADEGDPGAFMDRSVLEGDPHSVLEGMLIAAYAIGASQGFLYVRAEYPLAIRRLTIALAQMRERGLLGERILGTDFSFDIEIREGAGAFVCGEETALIASLEGRRGLPSARPPFPATSGLWGKPTNINNVETFANLPVILARGAAWFAGYGTEKSKGTKTFALTGKVKRSGLIEVPMGMRLGDVVLLVGGGIAGDREFKAVQTGGPSGGCLPARLADLPIDYESLAEAGSIMGSGGMVVLDDENCVVDLARFFLGFTQSESCGKCPPCRLGTKQMLMILEDICAGKAGPEDLALLEELAPAVKAASLCGLGQTAPNPVLSTLRYFREEYEAHVRDRRCPAAVCRALFRARCEHACPAGVNTPVYVGQIAQGDFRGALATIKATIPFAAVCGRVCHHPCESKCSRGQLDEPLAVAALKRFVGDYLADHEVARPVPPPANGRRAAVVGGGPAGLSAAWELARRGYRVKLYEALPVLGGMLAVGIPEYRLPKKVLAREIEDILALGVEVETGVSLGKDITLDELRAQGYDAIFLAIGAWKSTPLGVPGEDLPGVIHAIDLLREVNLSVLAPGREAPTVGERVAVIGGGNAAIDAARTALRLGAKEVNLVYRRTRDEMPALPREVEEAIREGVRMHYLTLPTRVVGTAEVEGLECLRMELKGYDANGRRRPVPVSGSEFVLPVDTVVVAVGQSIDPAAAREVETDRAGRVVADPRTLATSVPGVYAGGDAASGPSTFIDAIAQGLRAAQMIDEQVRGVPPARVEIEDARGPLTEEEEVIEQARTGMPEMAVCDRVTCFREVELGYCEEEAVAEANRCLKCHLLLDELVEA
jgi:NADH-quinone oxidoreductase subunit F